MNIRQRIFRQGGESGPAYPAIVPDANGDANARPERSPAASAAAAQESEWKQKIHQTLLKVIDLSLVAGLEEDEARRQIRDAAQRVMAEESVPLPAPVRQRIARQIEDEILGLGPLEPLLSDPEVTDILVNGPDAVYVERHGRLELTELGFRDDAHLMHIIDRIVTRVGRRIDEFSPMVDARLPDGSRVNAIIPPLAIDGALLSIRRFGVERLGMRDLIAIGSLPEAMSELLRGIVRARLNILISGGTGSGKTTLLNVISAYIPASERIVTIEDAAELQLQQPHIGRLETRPPNIEGKGGVTQRDLLRNALRMRPDRIIIGEVRGGEALDMLQAMNTGHDGSLTTVHANTPRDALTRIETMVAMAGVDMPLQATRSQIASGIDVVIQLERMEDGRRRVVSLQEIQGMEGDTITMSDIFQFRRTGVDAEGNVLGHFRATGAVPAFAERLQVRGMPLDFAMFNPDHSMS